MSDLHFTQRKSKELKERSSSARNIKVSRQLRNNQYFCNSGKNDNLQSATKQSKQYPKVQYDFSNQKSHSKNLNQNNDYIKNLYKKYLGKENSHHSDRKQKDPSKVTKNLFKQDLKDNPTQPKTLTDNYTLLNTNLTQQSTREPPKRQNEEIPYYNSKYSLTKNKSIVSLEIVKQAKTQKPKQQCSTFYQKLMDQHFLQMIGNPRSSLVRCMKTICKAKKQLRSSK